MTSTSLNPYEPSLTVLPNGVSLLNAPSASRNVGVFLIVRAGSRDETADTSGLAHYLEHMFFKGTATRPNTLIISREIDRLGANTNAYTDTEEVAYYAEGPATVADDLTDIITDMLTRPLFAAEEVERERNVVLQELSARLADPEGWIWDRLGTVAFGGDQPMAWSAAGFPAVIEKATRDQLLDYHQSFYAPESMCLTIAGGAGIAPERAAELLADVPTAKPRPRVPATWGQGDRYTCNVRPLTDQEEPQIRMVFAVPGIPATDEDRVALSVMTHILGGGMSSRLFHTVRERNGLCYSIFSHHEGFDDAGVFVISTGTRPKDARRATELSFTEFRAMAAERVPEDELSATKSAMIGRLLRSTETAVSLARFFGGRWRAGLPMETPDSRAEAISKVTAEQVQQVAQRIVAGLPDVRLAFVGPEDQGEDLLAATEGYTVV
ncbi:MAG: insulinase family protein [Candidatus Dormibacteraeota bacterium]|uniref:Insulinase family protein n=1 Tax=Candidatus Amunia macphersoniae TaxID=3127014 RepID=A0A934KHX1_9BACT|nr:insulinase family protein [Candidatus Dormibacteraeota bacterium]